MPSRSKGVKRDHGYLTGPRGPASNMKHFYGHELGVSSLSKGLLVWTAWIPSVWKYNSSRWSNKKCIGKGGSCRPFPMSEFLKFLTLAFVVFCYKTLFKSSHRRWKQRPMQGKKEQSLKEYVSTFQTAMTLDVLFRFKIFLGDDLMAIPPC